MKCNKSYEEKISDLNDIVEKLQESNMDLNQSIDLYKKGMDLYKECYDELEKLEISLNTISI